MEIDRERLAEIAQQFGLDLIVLFGSHAQDRVAVHLFMEQDKPGESK